MRKAMKKLIAAFVVTAMSISLLAGCGNKTVQTTPEEGGSNTGTEASVGTEKEVNLIMYLYGGEGVANKSILEALNEKLKASINATLEIKYIDWGDIATKYPLLWASGEAFDMAYVASNATVPYATLAKQDALADITDLLDTYAPTLKKELDSSVWDSMKVNGKIYGIPSTYSEYTAYGFVSRSDLMEKYSVTSISSIADMEAYMDAAVQDGMTPLNGSVNLAMDLYRMFVATTKGYIDAPGVPTSEMYLVGDKDSPYEVLHPAFTDDYEAFAVKMREWADKGYWSKDVLSASQDDKDNFYNGLSAGYISHQPDWTGNFGTQLEKLPGVDSEFYTFAEAGNKIVKKMGVENATAINKDSKNIERSLMLIEKLMTDEECYNLFQYGILGKQYEVVDGKITKPEGFNAEVDGGGFSGWALRTDKLNIPAVTEDSRRYELNEKWASVAIDNPYVGFSFDSSKVSAELSAIANVDSQLGTQILLGKTSQDPKEAVEEYRKQLQAAGIDAIIAEVNAQLKEFKAQ